MKMKNSSFTENEHTFALCAYKESPYLEKCVQSLLAQKVKSNIIICTSTPNDMIKSIAGKYGITLYENPAAPGIASDWNFAYKKAGTRLITIAHQDDIYDEDYLEKVLSALNRSKKPILVHSAYYEIRNDEKVLNNKLLKVKRLMLMPAAPKLFWNSRFIRRRVLSLGNAICCPSVTYVRDMLPNVPFVVGMKSNLDWLAWEQFSRIKGAFCYVKSPVMGHRVHEGSETSNVIGDGNGRMAEDYEMYRKFWPEWIAKILIKQYAKGQKSNEL